MVLQEYEHKLHKNTGFALKVGAVKAADEVEEEVEPEVEAETEVEADTEAL